MSNKTIILGWTDVYDTPYSNQYNTVANAFFLGLISISLAGCFLTSWKTRRGIPFSFVLCVAFFMEIISYALRFQGWSIGNFTTNVGLSTIAPIFITIAIHLSSAEVITNLGTEHAPLSPNAHLRLFIWTDILSALLQGIGLAVTFTGARPAGAWRIVFLKQSAAGQSILFTGLFLQSLSLAGALVCLTITYVKAGKADRKYGYTTFHRGGAGYVPLSPRSKTFLAILPLAGVCVLVRCTYRAAAAWGGLGSPIARDDILWLVAEGVLLTEAMVTLAVFHPAIWLDDAVAAASTRHNDMEAGGAGKERPGAWSRISNFSMGTNSSRGGGGKRVSYATTMGGGGDMQEPAQLHHHHARDSRADLHEVSQLIFQSRLIAPSDAGSSSSAANSRRGSSATSSQPDPYMHHHSGLYDDDASPYHNSDNMRANRYDPHEEDDDNHTVIISPETRDLSPLEAEAEADRISIVPEVPRKSSKRMSRLVTPAAAAAVSPATSSEGDYEDDDDDRLEVESVVLPLRKPSRKETTDDDDGLEDVALRSTYSTSLYSQ